MLYAWDELNIDHIFKHRVAPVEAEYVVDHANSPWPEQRGDNKFLVWGPTETGRMLQVIFVLKPPEEIAFESLSIDDWADLGEMDRIIYVVHAMELTPEMKRLFRKRRR